MSWTESTLWTREIRSRWLDLARQRSFFWNRLPAETRKRLLYFSATLDGLPTLAHGGVRIARLIGANALRSDQDSN